MIVFGLRRVIMVSFIFLTDYHGRASRLPRPNVIKNVYIRIESLIGRFERIRDSIPNHEGERYMT